MSIQTITISDSGNALITCGFNTSDKLLKILLDLITNLTKSEEIRMLEFSRK